MKDNPFIKFDKSRRMAIHRQWIRADFMKSTFEHCVKDDWENLDEEHKFEYYFISQANTFMYVWYALLFSVLEAFSTGVRRCIDGTLGEMQCREYVSQYLNIDKKLYTNLKKLRDATFHVRSNYWDGDMFKVFDNQSLFNDIHKIHDELGRLLLEAIKQ